MSDVYIKGPIELRLGDYRDVLADVSDDVTVIVDAPYSGTTHGGHRKGHGLNNTGRPTYRRDIGYSEWAERDVSDFVGRWGSCSGWLVSFTDDVLSPVWRAAYREAGRCPFAPLPVVATGMTVRLAGDGPSNWTTWLLVSRPRSVEARAWGTLPGAYVVTHGGSATRASGVVGAKPIAAVRSIVRDYSRPGDLVCDPCAGGATTLIAAALEGRRAIGAELDPETFAKACARIERTALTPPLPGMERKRPKAQQEALDLEAAS